MSSSLPFNSGRHPQPPNSGSATSFAAREAMAMAKRLDLPKFRVLMLSSFTIDPLELHLQTSEFLAGQRLAFDSVPYEQWQGALEAPGPIDEAAPDVIVRLLHLDDIAPLLAHPRLMAALEERFDRLISPEDQVYMLSFGLIGDKLMEPNG